MQSGSSPNPIMSSMMQGALNRQTAQDQQRMNMFGQDTPFGSLSYQADPSSPSGYRAVQSYTPEIQRLLQSNIGISQGASDAASGLISGFGDRYSTPLDLTNSGIDTRINSIAQGQLDPIWNQREEAFRQRMANQGLTPGSEAYANAERNFGDQRTRAYNDMALSGRQQAMNELLAERNQPLNELASLRGATTIATPVGSFGFTQTPQTSIQPVDYMGAVNDSYRQSQADRGAALGGMFGLGGTVLGGLAGGFGFGAPLSTTPQALRAHNGQAEWSPW